MKMRVSGLEEKSILMVEYRLVPLMVSVVKIGDELSAADTDAGAWRSGQTD